MLDFVYDESGRPFALNYSTNGGSSFTTYYYILNLQGDVVKLVNSSGTEYASYTYDAWGRILSTSGSLAYTNPLRYRGYYYDDETDFYYLQSRYYDPEMRRFINADSVTTTGQDFAGTNMFAYCGNNPCCRIDSAGMWWGEDVWNWTCNAVNDTLDWICNTAEDACEWVEEKVPIICEKAKAVAKAAYESIEFEFGVGLGMRGGCTVFDGIVGIELGLREDVFAIKLKDGKVRAGVDFSESATVSVPFRPLYGASDGYFQEYGSNEREVYSWKKYDKEQESVEIFGIGAYFFAGARVSLGFNPSKFFASLDEIFK